jgi:biotin synthase
VRDLPTASMPVNFLNPIPGTPLADRTLMPPREALRLIALARLAMPAQNIIVCGGREATLRHLQSLVFAAGANGILMGHYLTTQGQSPEADLRMIADLGLEASPPCKGEREP